MGRPIKKKFFGNTNPGAYGSEQQGSGVGGEGVASITVSNGGTHYSEGTTLAIGAPQIKGGKQATFSYSIDPSTGVISVTLTDGGTGYTSTPSLSVTKATTVSSTTNSGVTATNTFTVSTTAGIAIGMLISGASTGISGYVRAINGNVITSTQNNQGTWNNASNLQFIDNGSGFASSIAMTSRQNAIKFTSYLSTGSSAQTNGDIIKQEASKRYLVQNAQGQGQCKLVATDALAAGQMNIIATDGSGATYFVTKLTAHKAILVNRTSTSTALVSDLAAGWTLGAATGTNQVSIANN